MLPYERQLDVYDCLLDTGGETCPDCQDPASCQAERECARHTEELISVYPAWDVIE